MFVFDVVGFWKCKSLYLNEHEKCYGRQIYAFNPHKMKNVLYVLVIPENTLQEMLSNPNAFVS